MKQISVKVDWTPPATGQV